MPGRPQPQQIGTEDMTDHYQVSKRMSQAVVHNGLVYIAGQVADTRSGDLQQQTREVLAKIDALLKEAGTDKTRLLSVSVFLPHIHDFDAMNVIYDHWVDGFPPPARACTEARLADPDIRIEISAIGAMPGDAA